MEARSRELTELDKELFAKLEAEKSSSKCKDKQVACLLYDTERKEVLTIEVNTIITCDEDCDDKEHRICNVIHAEQMALNSMRDSELTNARANKNLIAYVNLFPCAPCQRALEHYVQEICAIGPIHKDLVYPVTVFDPAAFKA
jgi:deoxycytidylate deaminase